MFVKQTKGKYFSDLPKTHVLEDWYYASTKYDGHYWQIHKVGDKVKFFTSGGKELYISNLANDFIVNLKNYDFIIEAEYLGNLTGKLSQRGDAAKSTTYRTNFNKGIKSVMTDKELLVIFDIISLSYNTTALLVDAKTKFEKRVKHLTMFGGVSKFAILVHNTLIAKETMKEFLSTQLSEGFEGAYYKSPEHIHTGKRVNTAIKAKQRPTADLLCVDVEEGSEKYVGMIGSLVLVDSKGRTVKVGSGLSDADRMKPFDYYIGKVIEIDYEQILNTYVQATYVRERNDKTDKDIT
jgi:ATP-dependent DNA ligase